MKELVLGFCSNGIKDFYSVERGIICDYITNEESVDKCNGCKHDVAFCFQCSPYKRVRFGNLILIKEKRIPDV